MKRIIALFLIFAFSFSTIVCAKESDVETLARITMAEAEGEIDLNAEDPYKGWRLVIDTVLNRVDDDRFPDSIHDVIYQKNQFTSTTNGRMEKVSLNDDIIRVVEEELENRTNDKVIFFCSSGWPLNRHKMFKVGHHYFAR